MNDYLKQYLEKSKKLIRPGIIFLSILFLTLFISQISFISKPYYSIGEKFIYRNSSIKKKVGGIDTIARINSREKSISNNMVQIYFSVSGYKRECYVVMMLKNEIETDNWEYVSHEIYDLNQKLP